MFDSRASCLLFLGQSSIIMRTASVLGDSKGHNDSFQNESQTIKAPLMALHLHVTPCNFGDLRGYPWKTPGCIGPPNPRPDGTRKIIIFQLAKQNLL